MKVIRLAKFLLTWLLELLTLLELFKIVRNTAIIEFCVFIKIINKKKHFKNYWYQCYDQDYHEYKDFLVFDD